ncbi:hypothetical protein CDAR_525911 [Caerostris darwini]|uniref:Ycf15 n=1 Tax=Caerostris darwini TaxID=1538125 RepID=A0AAV4S455_9ARAC|nr:hypothetical protein CDAR_525911 [Caerostris darwini]
MLQIPFLRKVKPKEILVITHCTLYLRPPKNSSFPFCIRWREIMNNIRKPLHTSRADFGNGITSRYDCRPGFQNISLHASHFALRRKKEKDQWQREEDNKQSSTVFHLLHSE